jgi:peptide/nickel transport system substrate-binding protein
VTEEVVGGCVGRLGRWCRSSETNERNEMERNSVYLWVAMLMAVGLFAAACSSGEPEADPAPDAAPDTAGAEGDTAAGRTTLEAVMSEEATDLIPHTTTEQGKAAVLHTIFMPLLETDDANQIFSKILESWGISDDATTATLTLKPDIEWSDGTLMTSADVVMTLTQYLDNNISSHAGRIGGVVGQTAFVDGSADSISGLSAPDELTTVVELENPDVSWVNNLAVLGKNIPILPHHVLGEVPHDELLDHEYFRTYPVTSGPYKFVEFVPGQHAELEKNDNWSLGEPGFERVFLKILATDVMSAQLEAGEVQLMYPVDAADADRIGELPGMLIKRATGVAPELWSLMYYEPLLDPRVRQAMIYAIDREAICEQALQGFCTTPLTNTRQIAPEWSIPTEDMIEYRYDPERARELLEEANWDPNTELTFFARPGRSYVDTALAIAQGNMAEVGINWTIVNTDTGGLLQALEDAPDSALQGFWVSGADFTIDPSAVEVYVACDTHYPDGANTTHYCDPELDELFDAGRQAVDLEEREEIYHEAFRRLNQNPAEIYLYVVDSIVAHDSGLKGVKAHGNLSSHYWNIGEWYWEEE